MIRSYKNFHISLKSLAVLISFLLISTAADCKAEGLQVIKGHFSARQEKMHDSGVWVSRPKPSDEKVISVLRRNNIQTLQEYVQWLKDKTSYQKDTVDIWASPQETLVKKQGDCEDFAFLNAQVLQLLGYKTHVLALTLTPRNHAVCAFQKDGYYFWFDNNQLKQTAARSLKDLAIQISLEYPFKYVSEFLDQNNDWKLIFKSS